VKVSLWPPVGSHNQPSGTTPSGVKDGVSGTSGVPRESPGGRALLLVFGAIFLAIAKPDLLNRYAWGLILAADGVALLLGLVRPALRMRGLLKSGAGHRGGHRTKDQ
jgi:hypothetical protein